MQQTSALALLETSESPQDRELSFPDEEPLTMLRDAVTELIKALNSALNNERGSAAECIQRAEAILEWNSRHSTPAPQTKKNSNHLRKQSNRNRFSQKLSNID